MWGSRLEVALGTYLAIQGKSHPDPKTKGKDVKTSVEGRFSQFILRSYNSYQTIISIVRTGAQESRSIWAWFIGRLQTACVYCRSLSR